MYSLCDHCGNAGCILQSGIPRVSCAEYVQRVTLEDYIQQTVNDILKKKEEEQQIVWVVTYTDLLNELQVVVFDKYEEARKLRNYVRKYDASAELLERVVYDKCIKSKEQTDDPR